MAALHLAQNAFQRVGYILMTSVKEAKVLSCLINLSLYINCAEFYLPLGGRTTEGLQQDQKNATKPSVVEILPKAFCGKGVLFCKGEKEQSIL